MKDYNIVRVVEYYDHDHGMAKVQCQKGQKGFVPMKEMVACQPIVVFCYSDGLRILVINTLTRAINWDGIFIPSQKKKGIPVYREYLKEKYQTHAVVLIKEHNYEGEEGIISPSTKFIKGGVIYVSKMNFI